MSRDFDTFKRDMDAGRKRLGPLGRRGWEVKRKEVIGAIAQLENYTRLSNAQEQELEDLSMEQQVLESLITEDDIKTERQREAIRAGVKAGSVALEGGADGQPITYGRTKLADDEGAPWIRQSDGRKATVSRSQGWAEHSVVEDYQRNLKDAERVVVEQHGSLGNLVRSMSTTSGSAIVPTIWAGNIIDRARNASAVLRAGAQVVPMDAKQVQIGRITADPHGRLPHRGQHHHGLRSDLRQRDAGQQNHECARDRLAGVVPGCSKCFAGGGAGDRRGGRDPARPRVPVRWCHYRQRGHLAGHPAQPAGDPRDPPRPGRQLGSRRGRQRHGADGVDLLERGGRHHLLPPDLQRDAQRPALERQAGPAVRQGLRQPGPAAPGPGGDRRAPAVRDQPDPVVHLGHHDQPGNGSVRGRLPPAPRRPAPDLHGPDPDRAVRRARSDRDCRPLARRRAAGEAQGLRRLPLPARSRMMAGISPDLLRVMEHEAAQRAHDKGAFERDAASVQTAGVTADAYIHAVNDHGDEVVYVPGELLPAWVAEQVNAGKAPLTEASAGVRVRKLERKQPRSSK